MSAFKRFYFSSCCVLLIALPRFSRALPSGYPPMEPAFKIKQKLNDYFSGQGQKKDIPFTEIDLSRMENLNYILKETCRQLQENPSAASLEKVQRLIVFIGKSNHLLRFPSKGLLVMGSVRDSLSFLLKRFNQPSEVRAAITYIYNRLGLWGPEELWFFLERVKTLDSLAMYAEPYYHVIQFLNDWQLTDVVTHLRSIQPMTKLQLSLIVETMYYSEADLVELFKIVSDDFAKYINAQPRERPDLGAGDEIFADTLELLLRDYKMDNTASQIISQAFSDAKKSVQEQDPQYALRADRLLFFKLFEEGTLDWKNRGSWLKASAAQREKLRFSHQYETEDNVIRINFPCSKLLD